MDGFIYFDFELENIVKVFPRKAGVNRVLSKGGYRFFSGGSYPALF